MPSRPDCLTDNTSPALLDTLESEITRLWGHINAATYRFLTLVAEFDRAEGWARNGLANSAQWLNWQCGIGIVAAREKVRVARALEQLPKISESFRLGELSYSKVRAMTRVATAANEADLLNVALHGTAVHVERLVRCYRRVERLEEARQAEQAHIARYLNWYYDEAGCLVLRGRLPAETGALLVKALEAAAEEVEALETTAEEFEALAVDRSIERSGSAVPTDANQRPPLACSSDSAVAETPRASAEARRADALMRLAECLLQRRSAGSPSSAARYQVVVHVDAAALRASTAAPALEQASDPPLEQPTEPGSLTSASGDETRRGSRHRQPTARTRCELEDGPALARETARRLGCNADLVGLIEDSASGPLDVGRRTRAISPALRRALRARDGGCRFPGCDRSRGVEGHHVHHWADGGETRLDNLVSLCRYHHRQVHEGGCRISVTDDGVFVFHARDGRRIPDSGGRRFLERAGRFRGSVEAENGRHGLRIDCGTCRTRWLGERMDYSLAVEALWRVRGDGSVGADALLDD